MESVRRMLAFLLVVFGIYLIENAFVYIRLLQFLSLSGTALRLVKIGLWLTILAYPVARVLERLGLRLWAHHFTWFGSFWLGALVYLFFGFLIFDAIRYAAALVPGGRFFSLLNNSHIPRLFTLCLLAGTALLLVVGYAKARNPRVSYVSLSLQKLSGKKNPLRLVHLSDIHLGTIIGLKRLVKLVERVNALQPDLILITGDLVDENVAALESMIAPISQFRAERGVYAVTGNHEYYAGVTGAVSAMEQAGIRVLRNETVRIDGLLTITGVDDLESERFEAKPFPEFQALAADRDPRLPSILLCHRPIHLEKAAAAGFDLQLSGHTHHGQMVPFNWVTDILYEISSGFGRIGKMAVYVSNGVGTWGPPVRIGAPPEIVEIVLTRAETQ